MKIHTITHTHRHGITTYVFYSENQRPIWLSTENYNDREEIKDILSFFDIDFEDREDEYLEIEVVDSNEIPVID